MKTSPEGLKRKRKRDSTKWKAEIEKRKRLLGEAYLGFQTTKTDNSTKKLLCKERPARQQGPTCSSSHCRRSKLRHCEMFSEGDRKDLFNMFWSELDWHQKRVYILSSTEKVPTKVITSKQEVSYRSETLFYYLQRDGQKLKVCQKMFLQTLGVSQSQVFRWVKENRVSRKVNVNSAKPEQEGTRCAKMFLLGLPQMESHYCRRETSKTFLEPVFKSKAEVFRVYKTHCQDNNRPLVSQKKFASIVQELNIGIFQPKKDKCDTCCSYEAGNLNVEAWKAHISKKDEARKSKERDKKDSIEGLCHVIVVDVQAVKLSPMITASAMYYKTKLMVHN